MKMDIDLKDIESSSLEYIINLIENDMKANSGNHIAGYPLLQGVQDIAYRLRYEIGRARDAQRKAERGPVAEVEDEMAFLHRNIKDKFFKV